MFISIHCRRHSHYFGPPFYCIICICALSNWIQWDKYFYPTFKTMCSMVPLCHVTWLQHPILFGQQPSYLLHCTFPSFIFIDSIVFLNLSFLQVFKCLSGLGSFYSPKRVLAYKRAFLPITLNGIRFIPKTTITLITYLGSWAFVASIIAARFMVDQHPCLFEALTWVDNFPFQQHFKVTCDLLPF